MAKIAESLQRLLGIAAAGYGDQILIGFLIGYLKKADPDKVAECIQNDTRLISLLDQDDIELCRSIGQAIHVERITTDRIMEAIKEKNPSVYVTLQFHPKGMTWLENQVADIKNTLTS